MSDDRDYVTRRIDELVAKYELPSTAVDRLRRFVDLLADPAAATSVHAIREVVDIHIADALSAFDVSTINWHETAEICDLGSGAGVPGLVIAIALPSSRIWLLESSQRKCEQLARYVAELGLGTVEVVCARAEQWVEGLGLCNVICARAVGSLGVLCEYAAPLLQLGGSLISWKGLVTEREIMDGNAAAEVLGLKSEGALAVVPYDRSRQRSIHIFRKMTPTPPEFPRRPGMAAKRPLTVRRLHR